MAFEQINKPNQSSNDVYITVDTKVSDLHNAIARLWVSYINNRIYDNPVTLSDFFAKYHAFVGSYATFVNEFDKNTSELVKKKTKELYEEMTNAPVTKIDGAIRRMERGLRVDSEYHNRELKAFNNNITSMQTLLRMYGDEAKQVTRLS